MASNLLFDSCKELIGLFCNYSEEVNWQREIAIAKKLLKISPDIEAWRGIALGFKVNSLCFFLSPEGKSFIPASKRNPLLLDFSVKPLKIKKQRKRKKDNEPELALGTKEKPRTVFDFLKK